MNDSAVQFYLSQHNARKAHIPTMKKSNHTRRELAAHHPSSPLPPYPASSLQGFFSQDQIKVIIS